MYHNGITISIKRVETAAIKNLVQTLFGSPFFPPIVVEIMWPVTWSFPSITAADISYNVKQIKGSAQSKSGISDMW